MIGSREEANIYTQMVYEHILNSFSKLEHFSVILTTIFPYPTLSICRLPSNSFSSMVLTHLSINVLTFTDCLCLLDGRLKQLSTLDVEIYSMDTDLSLVRNFVSIFYLLMKIKILNLTFFKCRMIYQI